MVTVKNVTEAYRQLHDHRQLVVASASYEVEQICSGSSELRDRVVGIIANDRSDASSVRLLPWAVAGVRGVDPYESLLVCVASRLWWVGAETLDDVVDGDFDAEAAGMSAGEATIAGISCLTVLPRSVITRNSLPREVESAVLRELENGLLLVANGQAADLRWVSTVPSSRTMMSCYAGKTGAAYARDLLMLLELLGKPFDRRHWNTFGTLFGILQQLVNDRGPDGELTSLSDDVTLYSAHAAEFVGSLEDPRSRATALAEAMHRADVMDAYNIRIDVIKDRLVAMWDELADDSEYGDLVRWMIVSSAQEAKLSW